MQKKFLRLIQDFFKELKESRLWIEDKTVKQRFRYLDNEYNDIDFYKKYATIYHLRKALLTEDKKFDILPYIYCTSSFD